MRHQIAGSTHVGLVVCIAQIASQARAAKAKNDHSGNVIVVTASR